MSEAASRTEWREYWPEKGLRTLVMQPDGLWLDLVVTGPDGNIRAFLLPEWLIDAIIADHNNRIASAAPDYAQYLVNWADKEGYLEGHYFAFPDGLTYWAEGYAPEGQTETPR